MAIMTADFLTEKAASQLMDSKFQKLSCLVRDYIKLN